MSTLIDHFEVNHPSWVEELKAKFGTHLNAEVVHSFDLKTDKLKYRWYGKHANVSKWVLLNNRTAIGFNQHPHNHYITLVRCKLDSDQYGGLVSELEEIHA